jgi:hypothetical protein
MGTLNFWAEEDVMKRGLDRSCFGQESPVEVQQPQETSELTDGLGGRTSLEIDLIPGEAANPGKRFCSPGMKFWEQG